MKCARALAASALARLVSGLDWVSVPAEVKGLFTSREETVVVGLHVGSRENSLRNAVGNLTARHDEPAHAVDGVHAHQQLALAHQFQGEAFTQSLVAHFRSSRWLHVPRRISTRGGAAQFSTAYAAPTPDRRRVGRGTATRRPAAPLRRALWCRRLSWRSQRRRRRRERRRR